MIFFFKTLLLFFWAFSRQIDDIVITSKEIPSKFVFVTTGTVVLVCLGVTILVVKCNLLHFLKKIFFSWLKYWQTAFIVIMRKERTTNIKDSWGKGSCMLGCGRIDHIVKVHDFFKNSSSLLRNRYQVNWMLSTRKWAEYTLQKLKIARPPWPI